MIASTLIGPEVRVRWNPNATTDLRVSSHRGGPGRIQHRISLQIRQPTQDPVDKEITFAVDAPFDVSDLTNLDPFVIAALFPAMEAGGRMRVHGPVSRSLIRNVLDYQSAWSLAAPNICHPFVLEVDEIDDRPCPEAAPYPKTILAFTGGLDSTLALCRNISGDAGPTGHDIAATLMINGMGLGRNKSYDISPQIADLRRISERWDRPLAVVDTNLCTVVGRDVLSHGTWLAACLTLFSGDFDVGLLGSSMFWYSPGLELYGSHPFLDPMLSSGQMSIRNDEGLYRRTDKIALLTRYTKALEDLRVCFHPYRTETNCCRCEKCIRTMLGFIAVGHPIPPCFPLGIRLKDIGIGMGSRDGLHKARVVIETARENARDDESAIRVLRHRYRRKYAKVAAKETWSHLVTGRRKARWHILEGL
ncbi:MAG: hypothetical protein AAF414_06350 [Pseudomonadota bacterium]